MSVGGIDVINPEKILPRERRGAEKNKTGFASGFFSFFLRALAPLR